jgi:hypothetical protein
MKINHIIESKQINELIGGLKGLFGPKSAGAGYQQGEEQRRRDIAFKGTVDTFATRWINIAKNDPNTTPEELVNYARNITKVDPGPFNGDPLDSAQVTNYLTQALAKGRKAAFAPAPAPTTNTGAQDIQTQIAQKQKELANLQAQLKSASTTATTQTPATEPITIGGQKIMPNDPDYAKIMKGTQTPEPAATTTQPSTTQPSTQTPAEIRAVKQASAAKIAQDQMAANPAPPKTSTAVPTVGPGVVPQTSMAPSNVSYNMPEPKPGFLQTATDKIKAKNQPVSTAESIDLAEVLWRKMKSKK